MSKGIAATLTVALIAYLGVDTVWGLISGWLRLVEEVDRATTFEELRAAGERYGEVMGENAARLLVMLATAAIGNTAAGLGKKLPSLPGSAQAAVQAEAQGGLWLPAVVEVETVAMTAEGFTLALAPGAMAMAQGLRADVHHIATIENSRSTQRGGPWTPRFKELFAKGGMTLKDAENKVPLQGHKGPHPERYHRLVYKELYEATDACSSIAECRAALTKALKRLAREIATPGTELNRLLTEGVPR